MQNGSAILCKQMFAKGSLKTSWRMQLNTRYSVQGSCSCWSCKRSSVRPAEINNSSTSRAAASRGAGVKRACPNPEIPRNEYGRGGTGWPEVNTAGGSKSRKVKVAKVQRPARK